jgi:uncharacterized membrane protein YphA (DoxX/SURF4 family)
LRIGVGFVVLLDVLGTYMPRARDFFGAGSLSDPGTFTTGGPLLEWHRRLLDNFTSPAVWVGLLAIWAVAGFLLVVGVVPRVAAAVAWYFSISVTTINPALTNNGDQVRNTLLFMLMFCPTGAAWSLQAWRRRKPGSAGMERALIYPWALRLLLILLTASYFMNGLYKMRGMDWRTGSAMSHLLGDASWTRWSFAGWPMPAWLLNVSSKIVLVWELGFPVLLLMPSIRGPIIALGIGVVFHVVTGLTMRLGPFPLYMLCLYLPLLPWERLTGKEKPAASPPGGADTWRTAWRVQGSLSAGDSPIKEVPDKDQ